MDISTLLICISFISLLMMGVTGFLFYVNRSERYLIDWFISGACFALSNLLGILGSNISLPYVLVPSLGNAFYMAGHAAILTGIIRLVHNKNYRIFTLFIGIFGFSSHFLPFVAASVENRVIYFYCVIILLNLTSIFCLWNNKVHWKSTTYWPLAMTLILFMLQQLIRAIVLSTNTFNLTLFDSHFMQTSGSFFLLLYLSLLTVSYLMIVHCKQETSLKKAASIDPLTGWYNRKDIDKLIGHKYQDTESNSNSVGFIMLDIDNFKVINDQHGHLVGDKAIKHICNTTRRCIQQSDYCFRLGGEEFVICIADTNLQTLKLLAEKIRSQVESTPLFINSVSIKLTVSIGITTSSQSDFSWEAAVERADKALYQAKNMGRNRTVNMLPN